MQTSQAHTGRVLLPAEGSQQASPLFQLLTLFRNFFHVRRSLEEKIAARYQGCAWCDSVEQVVTHDILRR